MQDALSRFTLDSATEFLFGRCVHALNQGLPYPDRHPLSTNPREHAQSSFHAGNAHGKDIIYEFGEALETAQQVLGDRFLAGPAWPLLEIRGDRSQPSMRIVREFVQPILEDAIRKKHERMKSGDTVNNEEIEEDETLLDYLVKQTEGADRIPGVFQA